MKHLSLNMASRLPVSPQLLHHFLHFLTPLCWLWLRIAFCELGHIHLSKLLQGESPAMEAGAKPDCTNYRVNLRGQKCSVFFEIAALANAYTHFPTIFVSEWCFSFCLTMMFPIGPPSSSP